VITRLQRAPIESFTTVDRYDGPTFGADRSRAPADPA